MNVSEIESGTARNVLLQVVLNYGQTYKEVMLGVGIKKRALLRAVDELTSLGLVQKFHVEGEREYRLKATLPEPIVEATILERCIKADETNDLNAKILVIMSAIEEVFPRKSYDGKQPGIKQASRWLGMMGDSALRLYGLLEEARNATLTEGGPINYIEVMIANEAEPTPSEVAMYQRRKANVTRHLEAKEALKQSLHVV